MPIDGTTAIEGGELAATTPPDPAIQAQNTTLVHTAGFASLLAAVEGLQCVPAPAPEAAPWVLRYARQAAAVEILCSVSARASCPDVELRDIPYHRQAGCHRWLATRRGPDGAEKVTSVDLLYHAAAARVYLAGLQSCGSAWVCACCSGVICDRHRLQIQGLLDAVRSQGGAVAHLTLTVQHHEGEDFRALLKDLAAAKRKLLSGSAWEDFTAATGYRGSIRVIEVTHGGFGWHPHMHVLLVFERPYKHLLLGRKKETVGEWLSRRWLSSLAAVGRSGLRGVAAKLQDASWSAEEYLTKTGRSERWDMDAELTMHTRKVGRPGGVSPTGMLDGYLAVGLLGGDPDELPDVGASAWSLPTGRADGRSWYAALYREYATATRGLHMFHASEGLYDSYAVEAPAPDEVIAAGEVAAQGLPVLVMLTVHQWRQVLVNDARGELRIIAAKHAATGDLAGFWRDLEGMFIAPNAFQRSEIRKSMEGLAS